eukprot:750989-Hanusia_phi.AAC.8
MGTSRHQHICKHEQTAPRKSNAKYRRIVSSSSTSSLPLLHCRLHSLDPARPIALLYAGQPNCLLPMQRERKREESGGLWQHLARRSKREEQVANLIIHHATCGIRPLATPRVDERIKELPAMKCSSRKKERVLKRTKERCHEVEERTRRGQGDWRGREGGTTGKILVLVGKFSPGLGGGEARAVVNALVLINCNIL